MPVQGFEATVTPEEQARWETTKEFREQLAALQKPVLARWLWAVGKDWLGIAAVMAAAIAIDHVVAYIVAILLIGPLIHALGILGHDGMHRLACRNRKLNNALTQFFTFWPVHADINVYRAFHMGHHRHVNTPDDPELAYRSKGAPEWDLPRSRPSFLARYLKDLFGFGFTELYRVLLFVSGRSLSAWLGSILWAGIWVSIALLTGHLSILVMWYGAFFTSFVLCWRFRCWLEHIDADGTHRVHLTWWQGMLFAPHNVWYHYEHHKWASIPFYNLPAARKLDTSVSVISLAELYRFYAQAPPSKSGMLSARQQARWEQSHAPARANGNAKALLEEA